MWRYLQGKQSCIRKLSRNALLLWGWLTEVLCFGEEERRDGGVDPGGQWTRFVNSVCPVDMYAIGDVPVGVSTCGHCWIAVRGSWRASERAKCLRLLFEETPLMCRPVPGRRTAISQGRSTWGSPRSRAGNRLNAGPARPADRSSRGTDMRNTFPNGLRSTSSASQNRRNLRTCFLAASACTSARYVVCCSGYALMEWADRWDP